MSDDHAARLAAECPVRLTPAAHAAGWCVHAEHPGTGRVCHYREAEAVPEGYRPTAAQEGLWAGERRADGG